MRDTSSLYKQLRADVNSWCNIRVTVDGTAYAANNFKKIRIWSSLFEDNGPAIGGTISAEIELETFLDSSSWPRMAQILLDYQYCSADGTQSSEWVRMGVFYTEYRLPNESGTLTIHGKDQMRLLEQPWTDKIPDGALPTEWPVTAQTAVSLILTATGFELDPRTVLDNTTAFVGLDTLSTARSVLETVATGMGGNWCFTPEGKLRLIPLKLIYSGQVPAIAGVAIVGISIVGTSASSELLTPAVSKFSIGDPLPAITEVKVTADNGTVADAGIDGYTLNAACSFASSGVAALALSKVQGFSYSPFDTPLAWIDPAAELGDFLYYDKKAYPIYLIDFHINKHIVGACAAPAVNEIEEEYVVSSPAAKALRKSLAATGAVAADLATARRELNSSIQQSATSILTAVSRDYYTKDGTDTLIAGVSSKIDQEADSLEISITDVRTEANGNFNEIRSYIRYENNQVIVGKSDSQSDLRITNEEVGMYYGGVRQTYWNQNEQVTPGKVRIPVGGSLQEGNFLWQPRSSGNLSLMWVGGA